MKLKSLIFPIIMFLFAAGCQPTEEVERNWQLWKSHNIDSYEYELTTCIRFVSVAGCDHYLVTIVNNEVSSVTTYLEDNVPDNDVLGPIDDHFRKIVYNLNPLTSPDPISFDLQYGFPSSYVKSGALKNGVFLTSETVSIIKFNPLIL